MTVGAAKRNVASGLIVLAALAGFVAACSEIPSEPEGASGGALDSPTHEADSNRQMEERQEQDRRGGGGGGGGGGY